MDISEGQFIVLPHKSVFNLNLKDIFILDIGTNSIKVYSKNKDVIYNEASTIVTKIHSSKVLAYGNIGKEIFNKLPTNYTCSCPIKDGKIIDKKHATLLLKYVLNLVTSKWHLSKATCYLLINDNIESQDMETISEILKNLHIGKVIFVNNNDISLKSLKNDKNSPYYLLLTLGAGYSKISIIENNIEIKSSKLDFTGDNLDLKIMKYIATNFNMCIGAFEAQRIKEKYFDAINKNNDELFDIYGKDLVTCYHKKFRLHTSDIFLALSDSLEKLVDDIINFLLSQDDTLKNELEKSLRNMYILGGLSFIKNISAYLSENLSLEVKVLEKNYNILLLKEIINNKPKLKEYLLAIDQA